MVMVCRVWPVPLMRRNIPRYFYKDLQTSGYHILTTLMNWFPTVSFLWNFSFWGPKNIQQQHLNIGHKVWRISALEIIASMWFLSWWWMVDTRNICGIFSSCVHQITSYRHNTPFSCTQDTHWNQWRNRKCGMSLGIRVLLLQFQYDQI